jgi:hypothetical protein
VNLRHNRIPSDFGSDDLPNGKELTNNEFGRRGVEDVNGWLLSITFEASNFAPEMDGDDLRFSVEFH